MWQEVGKMTDIEKISTKVAIVLFDEVRQKMVAEAKANSFNEGWLDMFHTKEVKTLVTRFGVTFMVSIRYHISCDDGCVRLVVSPKNLPESWGTTHKSYFKKDSCSAVFDFWLESKGKLTYDKKVEYKCKCIMKHIKRI